MNVGSHDEPRHSGAALEVRHVDVEPIPDFLVPDRTVIFQPLHALPPKSCVELLAADFGVPWDNVDLTKEQRKGVPDSALTSKYDTLQDLGLNSTRESAWIKKISETVVQCGLVIVGLCHLLSMGGKTASA